MNKTRHTPRFIWHICCAYMYRLKADLKRTLRGLKADLKQTLCEPPSPHYHFPMPSSQAPPMQQYVARNLTKADIIQLLDCKNRYRLRQFHLTNHFIKNLLNISVGEYNKLKFFDESQTVIISTHFKINLL